MRFRMHRSATTACTCPVQSTTTAFTPPAAMKEALTPPTPAPGCRFKPNRAKEIMQEILKKKLVGTAYHADNTSTWAREIADDIKARLKGELDRKPVVGLRDPKPRLPLVYECLICSDTSHCRGGLEQIQVCGPGPHW